MKRIISIFAMVMIAFTLNASVIDNGNNGKSNDRSIKCPYLLQMESASKDGGACPYLKKLHEEGASEKSCPYLNGKEGCPNIDGKTEAGELECPYLKNHGADKTQIKKNYQTLHYKNS